MSAKIRSQWLLIFPALLLQHNISELLSLFHEAAQVFVEGELNRSEELGSTGLSLESGGVCCQGNAKQLVSKSEAFFCKKLYPSFFNQEFTSGPLNVDSPLLHQDSFFLAHLCSCEEP